MNLTAHISFTQFFWDPWKHPQLAFPALIDTCPSVPAVECMSTAAWKRITRLRFQGTGWVSRDWGICPLNRLRCRVLDHPGGPTPSASLTNKLHHYCQGFSVVRSSAVKSPIVRFKSEDSRARLIHDCSQIESDPKNAYKLSSQVRRIWAKTSSETTIRIVFAPHTSRSVYKIRAILANSQTSRNSFLSYPLQQGGFWFRKWIWTGRKRYLKYLAQIRKFRGWNCSPVLIFLARI